MGALEYFPEEVCDTKHCDGVGCYYIHGKLINSKKGEFLCNNCLMATDLFKKIRLSPKNINTTKNNIKRYEKGTK